MELHLRVQYEGIGGKLHYNITRTNSDAVPLPARRGGGPSGISQLTVNTQRSHSSWNVYFDSGYVHDVTAICKW